MNSERSVTDISLDGQRVALISDTHFGHANIIDYTGRPVKFEEMLVRNTKALRNGDIDRVIHVGDFGFFRKDEDAQAVFDQVFGSTPVVLIEGNHDTRNRQVRRLPWATFVRVKDQPYRFKYKNLTFEIQHRPWGEGANHDIEKNDVVPLFTNVAIHGHIHEKGQRFRWVHGTLVVNACVEHWSYHPFTLDELVDEFYERKQYYQGRRPRKRKQ